MTERQLASKFRAEMKYAYPEAVVQLLQDAPRSGKKPYDTYIACNGKFIAVEFKIIKGASLNPEIVTENQKKSLLEIEKCGFYGFVIVFSGTDFYAMRIGQLPEKTVKLSTLAQYRYRRVKHEGKTIYDKSWMCFVL